jgi:hypothetical protein
MDGMFSNRLALVEDFQRFAIVTSAVTDLTRHKDVWEEVHLDLDDAFTLAGLAPSTLHIEGEPTGLVPTGLGFRHRGKQLTNWREQAGVGCRVRTRRATDGALVDFDHFVEVLDTVEGVVGAWFVASAMQIHRQSLVERVGDQRALAGTGDAGNAGEGAQRELDRYILQIIFPGSSQD